MPRWEYMDVFVNILSVKHHIKAYDYDNNDKHRQKPKKMQQKFEKKVSKPFKP